MKTKLVLILLALFLVNGATAQQPGVNTYLINNDTQKRYLLVIPDDYNQNKTYHLLVFLHGQGDNGDNIARIFRTVGKADFVVACPHSNIPSWDESWVIGSSYDVEDFVMEILADVRSKVKVFDKVYVGGHSAGAHVSYYLSLHEKDLFAGCWPLAGAIISQTQPYVKNAKDKFFYIMHGASDTTVSVQYAYQAQTQLEANDAVVELIIYQGVGHEGPSSIAEFVKAMDWLTTHAKILYFDVASWGDLKTNFK